MIYCSNCGLANRDGAKYCNECGMRLGTNLPCPTCGESNLSPSHYCNFCGAHTFFDDSSGTSRSESSRQESGQIPVEDRVATNSEVPAFSAVIERDEVEASLPALDEEIEELAPEAPLAGFAASQAQDSEGFGEAGTAQYDRASRLDYKVNSLDLVEAPGSEIGLIPMELDTDSDISPTPVEAEAGSEITPAPVDLEAALEPILAADEGTGEEAPAEPIEQPSNTKPIADDLLPSWLMGSDEAGIELDGRPAVAPTIDEPSIEPEPLPVALGNRQSAGVLPWKRADGIVVARSIAGMVRIPLEDPGEPVVDEVNKIVNEIPDIQTSPPQPPSKTPDADVPKGTSQKKGSRLRRVLVYLVIAVLLVLAVAIVSSAYGLHIPESLSQYLSGLSLPQ